MDELIHKQIPVGPDRWASYEDLLASDYAGGDNPDETVLPLQGIRIVVCMDAEGNSQLRWNIEGGDAVYSVVGMLHQTAFLYQMHDLAHGGFEMTEEDE
jgi:hypothetical protein